MNIIRDNSFLMKNRAIYKLTSNFQKTKNKKQKQKQKTNAEFVPDACGILLLMITLNTKVTVYTL